MPDSRTFHIAIPAMNEAAFLPKTINTLKRQLHKHFFVWICINQPDNWWNDPDKLAICQNNYQTLSYLHNLGWKNIQIIDCSSQGNGWKCKATGVGQARRLIMDTINQVAQPEDIIVSLDADTIAKPDYLTSVEKVFERFPTAVALSNPYYHRLSGDIPLDRAMLRYEIYMRYYALNLWRIGSPYSFTALGSAIALPVKSYRKIGGMTAKKSGEDFYLLQKLRKTGWIANHNTSTVFPATRYSDRVFFGTGPALIKGSNGNWNSYPIYNYQLFDKVEETYKMFGMLAKKTALTPMSGFLNQLFGEDDIFEPLRKNCKNPKQFIKACHHKVDGLRVLQYLKYHQALTDNRDEENLLTFLENFFPDFFAIFGMQIKNNLDFRNSPLSLLNHIRNFLMEKEQTFQQIDRP